MTTRTSRTHRAYVGEGYSVTIQHCEGPGADGTGCDSYLGVNYPSDYCPDCKARVQPITTVCGCSLEPGVCTLHRDGFDHRHCTTCGIPVFFDDHLVEYDDHRCPPGFLLNAAETQEDSP